MTVAANITVIAIMTVWASVMTWWYYRKDAKSRADMLLSALEFEGSQSDTLVIKIMKRSVVAFLCVNFFQLCGLLMGDDVPYGININIALRFVVFDFNIPPGVFTGLFWFLLVVYMIVGALAGVRRYMEYKYKTEFKVPDFELLLRDVLLGALFIPSAGMYYGMLSCGQDSAGSWSIAKAETGCWSGIHVLYGLSAMACLSLVFPAALHKGLVGNTRLKSFQYIPRYKLIVLCTEFLLAGVKNMIGPFSILAAVFIITFAFVILFIWTFKTQPCLSTGQYINHIRSSIYAGSSTVGLLTIVTILVDDDQNPVTFILLFILPPLVMTGTYQASKKYLAKLQAQTMLDILAGLKDFKTAHKDPSEQISNLLDLSLATQNHEKILDMALSPLMEFLALGGMSEESCRDAYMIISNLCSFSTSRTKLLEQHKTFPVVQQLWSQLKTSANQALVEVVVDSVVTTPKEIKSALAALETPKTTDATTDAATADAVGATTDAAGATTDGADTGSPAATTTTTTTTTDKDAGLATEPILRPAIAAAEPPELKVSLPALLIPAETMTIAVEEDVTGGPKISLNIDTGAGSSGKYAVISTSKVDSHGNAFLTPKSHKKQPISEAAERAIVTALNNIYNVLTLPEALRPSADVTKMLHEQAFAHEPFETLLRICMREDRGTRQASSQLLQSLYSGYCLQGMWAGDDEGKREANVQLETAFKEVDANVLPNLTSEETEVRIGVLFLLHSVIDPTTHPEKAVTRMCHLYHNTDILTNDDLMPSLMRSPHKQEAELATEINTIMEMYPLPPSLSVPVLTHVDDADDGDEDRDPNDKKKGIELNVQLTMSEAGTVYVLLVPVPKPEDVPEEPPAETKESKQASGEAEDGKNSLNNTAESALLQPETPSATAASTDDAVADSGDGSQLLPGMLPPLQNRKKTLPPVRSTATASASGVDEPKNKDLISPVKAKDDEKRNAKQLKKEEKKALKREASKRKLQRTKSQLKLAKAARRDDKITNQAVCEGSEMSDAEGWMRASLRSSPDSDVNILLTGLIPLQLYTVYVVGVSDRTGIKVSAWPQTYQTPARVLKRMRVPKLLLNSIGKISRKDAVEVKSMSNPPPLVKMTMEAVIIILMDVKTKNDSVLKWNEVRKVIGGKTFIQDVLQYQSISLGLKSLRLLQKEYVHKDKKAIEEKKAAVMHASKVCGPLYQWVVAHAHFAQRMSELRKEFGTEKFKAVYGTAPPKKKSVRSRRIEKMKIVGKLALGFAKKKNDEAMENAASIVSSRASRIASRTSASGLTPTPTSKRASGKYDFKKLPLLNTNTVNSGSKPTSPAVSGRLSSRRSARASGKFTSPKGLLGKKNSVVKKNSKKKTSPNAKKKPPTPKAVSSTPRSSKVLPPLATPKARASTKLPPLAAKKK